MGVLFNSDRPVFWVLVLTALLIALVPRSAEAQPTTFGVDKYLCLWTNAPAAPSVQDRAACAIPSNQLSQIAPGQPAFYLVTITGNANPWNLALTETYPPAFKPQDVRCVPSGSTTPVFVASTATATTLGTIPIAANQTLHCTMAGYFITNSNIGTSATNIVDLSATPVGGSVATGSGHAKVTATVLTAATLPTDLSITKTPSTNSVALGGTVTFTLKLSNSSTGQPVYVGGFLQLYDQLLRVGSMALTATLTGPPVCTASGGAQCVTLSSTSPIALATYWQTLATGNYPSGNGGFLPPGGSMTVVYTLKIDSAATCAPAGTRGLRNLAGFNLAGQLGTAIAEANPANNQTNPNDDPSSLVTVSTPIQACPPDSENPSVSVTKVVQSPQATWPWGSTVTYNITVKNNSLVPLLGISLQDWVYSNYLDSAIVATVVGSPACSPSCGTSTPGSKVFGYSSANIWNSGSVASLAPGGTITVPITVKYDMDSCAVQSHANWRITNQVNAYYSTTAASFGASASAIIDMEEPPLCRFKVAKTFQGGAPTTLHFNTPYQYQVTYTNQSAKPATVYTLGDALRIDLPNYATSLPLTYRYSCTSPASPSVTGYSTQSPGFPAMSSGSVINTTTPVNGSQLISLAARAVKFDPGATLTCTIDIVVQRPATGDPNCMGTGAASLQNTALLYPGSGYYPWTGLPPDTDLWSTQKAKLPICFNLIVNKVADPLAALGTGPPLAYTVTVTNNGDPIVGLAAPNWLTLTDLFADNYSPGTATATVSNPTGSCGTSSQPNFNCELTGASGNPISLGIKNLAKGQTITVTYTLAPPFVTERVRNDVAIAAEGTLATDWYPRAPDTLSNLNEVPITNPTPQPTGGSVLKVCKVAGEGVDVGTPFDFTATAAGGAVTATVPAGPAPGGYCQIVGQYSPGTAVVLGETGPLGYDVTAIAVAGSAAMPKPDVHLADGKVALILGTGVTEATFTNFRGTGYVEICKAGNVRGMFEFRLDGRPLKVPAGACSPAIELKAGAHRLEEIPAPGTNMVGCDIYPADRKHSCQPSSGSVTFEVKAGSVASQTIVTVINRKSNSAAPSAAEAPE